MQGIDAAGTVADPSAGSGGWWRVVIASRGGGWWSFILSSQLVLVCNRDDLPGGAGGVGPCVQNCYALSPKP